MIKKILTSLTIAGLAISASAVYELIDDFQDPNWKDNYYWGTNGIDVTPWDNGDVYTYLDDETNFGLYVDPEFNGISNSVIFWSKSLPGAGIQPNSKATIYFRYNQEGPSHNVHFGTSHEPLVFTDEVNKGVSAPAAWGHFNYLFRKKEGSPLEHRDGGGYTTTDPGVFFEDDVWYEFWMVIDNKYEVIDEVLQHLGTYELYIKGPNDSAPVLINVGTSGQGEASTRAKALTAEGAAMPIIWFMCGVTTDDSLSDFWFYDDAYIDYAGENLLSPFDDPLPTWNGLPVDGNGNVDTGDWMGIINVSNGDFVYSYTLEQYIYLPESIITDSGSWTYFFK
jgi:hypothetical protein